MSAPSALPPRAGVCITIGCRVSTRRGTGPASFYRDAVRITERDGKEVGWRQVRRDGDESFAQRLVGSLPTGRTRTRQKPVPGVAKLNPALRRYGRKAA